MVCDGPDPPDSNPQEISTPPRHDLMMNGALAEDSGEDEPNENFGYEPLPQAPEAVHSDRDSDEELEVDTHLTPSDLPIIEPMETALAREVWTSPRPIDPIQMDSERAQQVMSAMANFALPQGSIPEWAQSINEEQWKQTLTDRIEKMKGNR